MAMEILSNLDRRMDAALGGLRARITPQVATGIAAVIGLAGIIKIGPSLNYNSFFAFIAFLTFAAAFMFHGIRGASIYALIFSFVQPFLGRLIVYMDWLELGSFESFGVSSDLFRTSVNLFLFLCLAMIFVRNFVDRRKIVENPLDLFILVFLVICTLQSLNPKQDIVAGIYGFRQEVGTAGLYFVGKELGYSPKTRRVIAGLFIGYLVINSVLSICQYHGILLPSDHSWLKLQKVLTGNVGNLYVESSERPDLILDEKDMHLRPLGMASYNADLIYPVAGMCIFLISLLKLRLTRKPMAMLAIGSAIILLLATRERTGLGMIVLGSVLGLVVFAKPVLSRSIFYGILAFLFVWLPLYFAAPFMLASKDEGIRRMAELANPFNARSMYGRTLYIFPVMIAKVVEFPFGYGLGSGRTTRATVASGQYVLPHNEFLQKIYELGVIGFIVYICIFITVFVLARKAVRMNHIGVEHRQLTEFTLASLFAFLACSMMNLAFSNQSGLVFWTALGMFSHAYTAMVRQKPAHQVPSPA